MTLFEQITKKLAALNEADAARLAQLESNDEYSFDEYRNDSDEYRDDSDFDEYRDEFDESDSDEYHDDSDESPDDSPDDSDSDDSPNDFDPNSNALTTSIPLDLIDMGLRAREELGDIDSLAENIHETKLLHPIGVMRSGERYKLIYGGRRLLAYRLLRERYGQKYSEISACVWPEMSELRRKEMELFENLKRQDMSEIEVALLRKKILDLRNSAAAIQAYGNYSQRKLAAELGVSVGTVNNDIQLATEILKLPPETQKRIKQIGSKSEVKALLTEANRRANAVITATTAQTAATKSLRESFQVKDTLEALAEIPQGTVDLIEIDPPFGIDFPALRKANAAKALLYNEITTVEQLYLALLLESQRILRDTGWCIFWSSPYYGNIVQTLAKTNALTLTPCQIAAIWYKDSPSQTNNPRHVLANAYEAFTYLHMPKATIAKPGRLNVFVHKRGSDSDKNVAEKPVELYNDIFTTFLPTDERKTVVIAYAGSGNAIIAARQYHNVTGFDNEPTNQALFIAKCLRNEKGS